MRPARRTTWLAAFLVLLEGAASCGPDVGTSVLVTVEARPTVGVLDGLHLELANGGATRLHDFSLRAGTTVPFTFSVTAEGRAGELSILAEGLCGGRRCAAGTTTATLREGATVPATLTLEPDDFVVNAEIGGFQWLTYQTGLLGRQAAVASDGSFLVAWENDCPLARCDLVARLFEPDATPRRNGTSMTTGDFFLNQQSEYTETATVAGGSAGYLAAWIAAGDVGGKNVRVAALDFSGAHRGADQLVSEHANEERAPSVLALADGRYVVAWEQFRTDPATQTVVRARLLGADGAPATPAFEVSSVLSGDQDLPHGAGFPGGAGGGFVLVWAHTHTDSTITNVRARIFDAAGAPVNASDVLVTELGAGQALGPHVAATPSGFVVAWRYVPPTGTPSLLARRYEASGSVSSPITVSPVSSEASAQEAYPAVAVRPGDGAIALAWHDCGARGDGDDCGILMRVLHPSGLPSGPAFVANTTTRYAQDGPSLAALLDGGFLVAWTDDSGVEPDTDQSAIRARAVYPSLERHDGDIGARCGGPADAECASWLVCARARIEGIDLCHPTCTTPDLPCAEGGVCRAGLCMFE